MAKRGQNQGSIRQLPRKRETWEIAVTLPPDPRTGLSKRASRLYYGDREGAENDLRKWLTEVYEGDHVPPDRKTVAQLAHEWLRDEKASRLRLSTLQDYTDTIENHLIPRLGTVRVQRLTVADVHKMMTRMEREGVGARTRQLTLMRLKQMLGWAVAMEYVKRNVAAGVEPPAHTKKLAHAMSHAELRAFLEAAKRDVYWPLWLVYATTGMRRGEALGLRWQDVDLGRKRLIIVQQVSLVKGEDNATRPCVQELKTSAARRTLDLDFQTVDALLAVRSAREEQERATVYWEANDLVFRTRHGTPHNPNNLYDSFAVICEDAGLDPKAWTIHDLRHTHASHLILAGVPIIEVSKRLGHADPSITLRVYAHMVDDHQGRAVAAVEAALFPGLAELTP